MSQSHRQHQLLLAATLIRLQRHLIDRYEQATYPQSMPSTADETAAEIIEKQQQIITLYKQISTVSNELHQSEYKELAEQIDEKNKRIKELEKALADAKRAGKRQVHPFRKNSKDKKNKPRGRKPGQGTFKHRHKPEGQPDQTIKEPLLKCPDCACADLKNIKEHKNIQIDLPKIEPIVTEFITYSGDCPCCHKRVQSMHPKQLSNATGAAAVSLGPRTLAVASDMHKHLGASYEKIADYFSQIYGFTITRSGIYQAIQRLAAKAKPIYQQLIDSIRAAAVVHADETGWRIGVLSAWLWVFSNKQTTVYTIHSGKGARGHDVVIEILGKKFAGTLVSDCFRAYDAKALDDWIKQKCLAHLLRDLRDFRESGKIAILAFAKEAIALFQDAIQLKDTKDQFAADQYQEKVTAIEGRLDDLISNYGALNDEDAARFVRRLQKQRAHLFTFLKYDEVDPTNNHGERMIRPGVLARKTQACNKTDAGAKNHAVLTSIHATLRQRKIPVVDYIVKLLLSSADNPPPIPEPP